MARGKGSGGFIFGLYNDIVEAGRHVCCCACCLLCTGPILLLIGFIVLASAAVDTRKDKVKQYNAAVDLWKSTYYAQFEQASFTNMNAASGDGTFSKNTQADPMHDSDPSSLHTYTGMYLKYSQTGLNYPSPSSSASNQPVSMAISAQQGSSASNGITVNLDLMRQEDVPYYNLPQSCTTSGTSTSSSSSQSCQSVCNSLNGQWNYGTQSCKFIGSAQQICVKVSLQGSAWALDQTYGGPGCFPCAAFPNTNRVCEDYQASQLQEAAFPISYGGTVTYVRSANDPYILAGYLSGGSFDFGLTRAQKLVLAIVILAIGGCFCCFTYGSLYFVAMWFRGRNEQNKYQRQHNGGTAAPYGAAPSYGSASGPGQQPYQAQMASPVAQPVYQAQPAQQAAPPPSYNAGPAPTYV